MANNPPIAANDSFTVTANVALGGNVITGAPGTGQDTDADAGDRLRVDSIQGVGFAGIPDGGQQTVNGQLGTLTIHSDGTFDYIADKAAALALLAGATRSDNFTYEINDGHNATSQATLSFTVTGTNHVPDAVNDQFTVAANVEVVGNVITGAPGTGQDTDADAGDRLRVDSIQGVGFAGIPDGGQQTVNGHLGTLTIHSDGTFDYTADKTAALNLLAGTSASDDFTYEINDGRAASDQATLSFTVAGTNHVPDAVNDQFTVTAGGSFSGNVITGAPGTGQDTDADAGDRLRVDSIQGTGFAGVPDGGQDTVNGQFGTLTIHSDGTFDYTADKAAALAAGTTATDNFTYEINDGRNAKDQATLSFTVTASNHVPDAVDDQFSVAGGGSFSGNVITGAPGTGQDSDPDADPLRVDFIGGPGASANVPNGGSATIGNSFTFGTLTIHSDGTFAYTADHPAAVNLLAGNTGSDSFTYEITDGRGGTSQATLSFTITGQNHAPDAVADDFSVTAGGTFTGNVITGAPGTGQDSDADGDPIRVDNIQGPGGNANVANGGDATIGNVFTFGTLTIHSDGTFTYTADHANALALLAGNTATDVFTYEINDGRAATDQTTLSFTVTGQNHTPDAVDDDFSVAAGGSLTGNVITGAPGTGQDSDPDNDPLRVDNIQGFGGNASVVDGGDVTIGGQFGTLTIHSDGTFAYAADKPAALALAAGTAASDDFTYEINDGRAATDQATLSFTVTGAASGAPTANDDSVTTPEDTPVTILGSALLANDSDPNGDQLSITAVGSAQHGSVTLNGGDPIFTPEANFNGAASFVYTVADGNGGNANATVTVNVTAVNDPPTLNGVTLTIVEDGTTVLVPADFSITDPDSTSFTFAVSNVTHGTFETFDGTNWHAAATFTSAEVGANSVRFVHDGGETAPSFSITANDGSHPSNTIVGTVNFTNVNDAPAANDDHYLTGANTVLSVPGAGVLANDTDADGDALAALLVSGPAHGTLTLQANGSFTYTPDAGYHGDDAFIYRASDSTDASNVATVDLTIGPARAVADFNGDGHSDLMWRQDDGLTAIWHMNGTQIAQAFSLGQIGTSWRALDRGDFDGDGKSDILWRDDSGLTAIWEMDGGHIKAGAPLGVIGTAWQVQPLGDFDGDGKSDILWRDEQSGQTALWEMDGGHIKAGIDLGVIGAGWHVAAAADFDGDGKSDIVWRHDSGQTAIWEMDGGRIKTGIDLGSLGPTWQVAGTGDFDGDGKADILWREASGLTALWEMDGGHIRHVDNLGMIPPSVHVADIGDFDGNGTSDILWRNDNGQTALWEMNGAQTIAAADLGTIGATWHAISDHLLV